MSGLKLGLEEVAVKPRTAASSRNMLFATSSKETEKVTEQDQTPEAVVACNPLQEDGMLLFVQMRRLHLQPDGSLDLVPVVGNGKTLEF